MRFHHQVPVFARDGRTLSLDRLIVPAVEALWALDQETLFSCEGGPSHFPDVHRVNNSGYLVLLGERSAHDLAKHLVLPFQPITREEDIDRPGPNFINLETMPGGSIFRFLPNFRTPLTIALQQLARRTS